MIRQHEQLTGADLVKIHRLREEGLTYKQIAQRFGVSPETVRQTLKRPLRHGLMRAIGSRFDGTPKVIAPL